MKTELFENLEVNDKYHSLLTFFQIHSSAIVAFSGGIDSTLLLKVASDILPDEKLLAVTAASPSVPDREIILARKMCREIGVRHRIVYPGEVKNKEYRENDVSRCYICKSTLYNTLEDLCIKEGYEIIVNGLNADDMNSVNSGYLAGKNSNVFSPLMLAGLTKKEIREISKLLGLSNWDKPSTPCLSARIPHGKPITETKLQQIDLAESFIISNFYKECRVFHEDGKGIVELPDKHLCNLSEECKETIEDALIRIGFDSVLFRFRKKDSPQ